MARVPAALVRLVQTQGLHGVLIGLARLCDSKACEAEQIAGLAHELPLWKGRADLLRALAKQMGED